jgi:hypothetical protein
MASRNENGGITVKVMRLGGEAKSYYLAKGVTISEVLNQAGFSPENLSGVRMNHRKVTDFEVPKPDVNSPWNVRDIERRDFIVGELKNNRQLSKKKKKKLLNELYELRDKYKGNDAKIKEDRFKNVIQAEYGFDEYGYPIRHQGDRYGY